MVELTPLQNALVLRFLVSATYTVNDGTRYDGCRYSQHRNQQFCQCARYYVNGTLDATL
jgi:hypothetical protein